MSLFFQGSHGNKIANLNKNTDLLSLEGKANNEISALDDVGIYPHSKSYVYPNAVTCEHNHAQLDARRAFTPESFIKMALINAITGPLDMNNGNFDLIGINSGLREKGPIKLNSYVSTITSETARTLIIFSGLVIIPDAVSAP